MAATVCFTLISDGSSDKALLHVCYWLLAQHLGNFKVAGEWPDFRILPNPPRTLADKIYEGLRLNPCNILFVHRDAEGQSRNDRVQEIQQAFEKAAAC